MKITATLLACGIDPGKSILFQQSRVSISMHRAIACTVRREYHTDMNCKKIFQKTEPWQHNQQSD
jgi:tryptophanyl-tRNA synthetase